MKVKICGITSCADALSALECGADFLGLIFEPKSPRAVDLQSAAAICTQALEAYPDAKFVGVFVSQTAEFIKRAVQTCGLFAVQLHGGQDDIFVESIEDCGAEIWRAVWLNDESDLRRARDLKADAIVADSRGVGLVGGTGRLCDWNFAERLARVRRTILAGGISPQNASSAASSVNPYALDANSGVEISPRKKDILKIKSLIEKVKQQ